MSEIKIAPERKLTDRDLRRVFWRSCMLDSSWNYERQQNIGYSFGIVPVIEKVYEPGSEKQKRAYARSLDFMAITPQLSTLLMGIDAAMEEENAANDEFDDSAITAVKTSLMGPFAGLGDSMLNLTWYPIAGSIGASLCVSNGSLIGPLVMFLLINVLYWPLKYFGIHMGYTKGMELIEQGGVALIERLGNLANVLGVIVVGCLIPQIAFSEGDPLVIQTQLDAVMPYMLPVILTLICYKLIKKGQGKNTAQVIIGIIVFALVFAAIGYYTGVSIFA